MNSLLEWMSLGEVEGVTKQEGERSYTSVDILVCRRQGLNTPCTLLSCGGSACAPRDGVRDGLEDEAPGRGDRTGGGHTGEGWSSRGLFSAWECGAEAVGLLAVHDLMCEAEVSGMVLGHSISSVVIRCTPGGQ